MLNIGIRSGQLELYSLKIEYKPHPIFKTINELNLWITSECFYFKLLPRFSNMWTSSCLTVTQVLHFLVSVSQAGYKAIQWMSRCVYIRILYNQNCLPVFLPNNTPSWFFFFSFFSFCAENFYLSPIIVLLQAFRNAFWLAALVCVKHCIQGWGRCLGLSLLRGRLIGLHNWKQT